MNGALGNWPNGKKKKIMLMMSWRVWCMVGNTGRLKRVLHCGTDRVNGKKKKKKTKSYYKMRCW